MFWKASGAGCGVVPAVVVGSDMACGVGLESAGRRCRTPSAAGGADGAGEAAGLSPRALPLPLAILSCHGKSGSVVVLLLLSLCSR